MSKSLIRFTLFASMVIPFAVHADVKVYGHAQAELATYSDETVKKSENDTSNNAGLSPTGNVPTAKGQGVGKNSLFVEDNARGRIGIKASEDLGMMGLKGIAGFEWKVDTTDNQGGGGSNNPFAARESYVGLQGGFGTISFGRLKQPYKYAGGVTYDAFVTTALEARGKGGMSRGIGLDNAFGHNGFFPKALGYNSPEMGGLSLQLAYRLDEGAPIRITNAGVNSFQSAKADGAWMAALQFKSGPIHLFVAANDDDKPERGNASTSSVCTSDINPLPVGAAGDAVPCNANRNTATVVASEYSAVKVGGKFSAGNLALMVQYEMLDNNGVDETVIFLGAQMKIDKATLVLQLGQDEYDGTDTAASKFDAITYAVLGGIYNFSKETRIFGGYRATSDFENVFTVGIRKDFST